MKSTTTNTETNWKVSSHALSNLLCKLRPLCNEIFFSCAKRPILVITFEILMTFYESKLYAFEDNPFTNVNIKNGELSIPSWKIGMPPISWKTLGNIYKWRHVTKEGGVMQVCYTPSEWGVGVVTNLHGNSSSIM